MKPTRVTTSSGLPFRSWYNRGTAPAAMPAMTYRFACGHGEWGKVCFGGEGVFFRCVSCCKSVKRRELCISYPQGSPQRDDLLGKDHQGQRDVGGGGAQAW